MLRLHQNDKEVFLFSKTKSVLLLIIVLLILLIDSILVVRIERL